MEHETGKETERDAQHRQKRLRHQHDRWRFISGGCLAAARQRQKADAERFDETRCRERSRQRQDSATNWEEGPDQRLGGFAEAVEERLKREPFARKAVQRRQPGNGHRPDQEEESRRRHATQETAELLDVPRAGSHDHAARTEE